MSRLMIIASLLVFFICGTAGAATATLQGVTGNNCTYTGVSVDASGNMVVTCQSVAPGAKTVNFSSSAYNGNEGSTITLALTRSDATDAIQVQVQKTGGTATSSDFSSSFPLTVNFAAGVSSTQVTIQTLHNSNDTSDKTLTLGLAGLPSGWSAASPASVNVTITNIDNPTPGNCPATSARIDTSTFAPGLFEFSTSSGAGIAFAFTSPLASMGGFKISAETSVAAGAGGALPKDYAISTCPGDFTSANVIAMATGKTAFFSVKYASQIGYISGVAGTRYYLNIRPAGGTATAVSGVIKVVNSN